MKIIFWSLVVVVVLGGWFLLSRGVNKNSGNEKEGDNVSMVIGKQVINILAKGGYSPRVTLAKADLPSVIKMQTNGTFDCSASVTIPSLNYRTMLVPTGVSEVEVPAQKAGAVLRGSCGMGMYSFEIRFS